MPYIAFVGIYWAQSTPPPKGRYMKIIFVMYTLATRKEKSLGCECWPSCFLQPNRFIFVIVIWLVKSKLGSNWKPLGLDISTLSQTNHSKRKEEGCGFSTTFNMLISYYFIVSRSTHVPRRFQVLLFFAVNDYNRWLWQRHKKDKHKILDLYRETIHQVDSTSPPI